MGQGRLGRVRGENVKTIWFIGVLSNLVARKWIVLAVLLILGVQRYGGTACDSNGVRHWWMLGLCISSAPVWSLGVRRMWIVGRQGCWLVVSLRWASVSLPWFGDNKQNHAF